jgi:hypothetical protein
LCCSGDYSVTPAGIYIESDIGWDAQKKINASSKKGQSDADPLKKFVADKPVYA